MFYNDAVYYLNESFSWYLMIELASKKVVDNSHEARYNEFLQFL